MITKNDIEKTKNAILLAAGAGIRMVPINTVVPKPLLEVNGEKLIDRLIRQLKEAHIDNIIVVTGYMNESFEYLNSQGIHLIYNDQYNVKNNLHSLSLASDMISNTYVVPCDIWCKNNPFLDNDSSSWYMVTDQIRRETGAAINRENKLVRVRSSQNIKGNKMIGIAYLTGKEAKTVVERIDKYSKDPKYDGSFWETVLFEADNAMILKPRIVSKKEVFEINTYEQLRDLDPKSEQLESDALNTIAKVFSCETKDIIDIQVMKKGMTNRSFRFAVKNNEYIMRVPGEGTDKLIDHQKEVSVYRAISGLNICDDPVYFDPDSGYKITRYIKEARCCDPNSTADLRTCMKKLREFHSLKLSVPHVFDLFRQIDFYESLWNGKQSSYKDYSLTKQNIFCLKSFIEQNKEDYCLAHIDAVADNFLFDPNRNGELSVQLIDWEYAGMQDPHVDIAMFAIYSCYNKKQIDKLIDLYFEDEGYDLITKAKIYAYIAVCGLLWSNWCEYKQSLGIEFGEYSYCQYQYAKKYYRYTSELIEKAERGQEI